MGAWALWSYQIDQKAYHFEPKTDHVLTKFDHNDPISDQFSFFSNNCVCEVVENIKF